MVGRSLPQRDPPRSTSITDECDVGLTCCARPCTMRDMVAGQDRLLTQMRRGTLEYCVLALLNEEERYGFDLVRALGEADGMVTSEGTIYPLLSRLRRDGLVSTTWEESPSGPPRRYYRLTAKGRQALSQFVQEWQRFRDAVDRFMEGGSG
jgi:PadR family transcriptional regulator, regulatory protein PadR